MGWFNFKKQKSPEDEAIDFLAEKIFPGGERERMMRGIAVSELCSLKLDFKEAVYIYSKIKGHFNLAVMFFDGVTKKGITAEELIQIAINSSKGKLTYLDAVAIVSYTMFGRAESVLASLGHLKIYFAGLFGSDEQGYDADVLPFGIGEFGLEATNPIPARGSAGSHIYISRLRSTDGQSIMTKRLRALKVAEANILVDEYEAYDQQNRVLCKLYVCAYHQRISKKAPKGFTLATV